MKIIEKEYFWESVTGERVLSTEASLREGKEGKRKKKFITGSPHIRGRPFSFNHKQQLM